MSIKHSVDNGLVGRIVNTVAATGFLLLVSVAYFSAISGLTPSGLV